MHAEQRMMEQWISRTDAEEALGNQVTKPSWATSPGSVEHRGTTAGGRTLVVVTDKESMPVITAYWISERRGV